MRYRAEVIGKVPQGLTHNDVFASFNMMMRERVQVESLTKRRLSGGMISLITVFECETNAGAEVMYAAHGVTGFVFDVIIKGIG